mgnify:CR=1 FL=1
MSAAAVLWCLLARHWSVGLAPKAVLFVVAEVLMILFLPAVERSALGGAPYGPPGLVRFVLVMYTVLLAFGPKTATPTLIFPMAAANDWHRRAKVLGCLGDVFDAPGLSAGDLVRPTESTDGKVAPASNVRIYLDPHDPRNVFAHAMMRPVLRRVARKIQLRCQAYLWIYFAGAIAALVVLNVLLWYPLSHRLLAAHLAALPPSGAPTTIVVPQSWQTRLYFTVLEYSRALAYDIARPRAAPPGHGGDVASELAAWSCEVRGEVAYSTQVPW